MPTSFFPPRKPALFAPDLVEQILLSCHLLGKPTAAQLWRLHQDHVSLRGMQGMLKTLSGSQELLSVIKPIEISKPQKALPYLYLDTWASRRRIEQIFGVPFRRPPELPSRDWRFLFHDATLPDDLISFELSARNLGLPFGYQTHFSEDDTPFYPSVTVTDGAHTHSLRPRPDKTLIIGDHHIVHEHDLGEEQISLGHIIRDSSFARKTLVYEQVEQSGALDRLGWGKRLYTVIVNGKKRTKTSSRKRISTMIETLPQRVDPRRFFFLDRQTHQEAGDEVSSVTWLRGDGRAMPLPCW